MSHRHFGTILCGHNLYNFLLRRSSTEQIIFKIFSIMIFACDLDLQTKFYILVQYTSCALVKALTLPPTSSDYWSGLTHKAIFLYILFCIDVQTRTNTITICLNCASPQLESKLAMPSSVRRGITFSGFGVGASRDGKFLS